MASVFKRGGKTNRGGSWYVSWFDHGGKRRVKCSRTTDKAAAERIGAKLDSDAALRRDRVIDPALEGIAEQSRRTVESHLADFKAKLQAAGRSADHVHHTAKLIREVADAAGFRLASDISADGVNCYAQTMKDAGKAARTIQARIVAIKAFSRWLANNHKLPRDPLASVQRPSMETEGRKRRMLLPDEWAWLRHAAESGELSHGMQPAERVLLYATAIQTGLRSAELRTLTRGKLYLSNDPPFVLVPGRSTKNRKEAKQYITGDLAAELRQHIATKAPTAPVFNMPVGPSVAAMLLADLAKARKQYLKSATGADERLQREQSDFLAVVNHEGERFDFHALRHTCGGWLAMQGEHPKTIQTVMRHSVITLTMDTYGHLLPGQAADAVAKLPALLADSAAPMRATGTIDAHPGEAVGDNSRDSAQRHVQHSQRDSGKPDAAPCDEATQDRRIGCGEACSPNTLPVATLGEVVPNLTSPNDSGRGGDRTRTRLTPHRILSPVRLPVPPLGLPMSMFRYRNA